MNELLVGLLILAATSLLPLTAYRSNLRSDISWEQMRRELTPTWYLQKKRRNPMSGMSMEAKTYYSQQLLSRLSPALNNAKTFENGYTHALLHHE